MSLSIDDLFWDDEVDQFPQPTWLIRDILPREAFIQLAGEKSSKKTFLALDMAFHVAMGRDWHEKFKTNQGKVVFVFGEGRGGTRNRVNVWKLHNKVGSQERSGVILINRPINLGKHDEIQDLINFTHRQTKGEKVALFVFDTLNVCSEGADESSSKDMGMVVSNVKKLIRQYQGCSVMVLHHPGHQTGKRGRGHSSIPAALDAEIFLTKKSDHVLMECYKQKDADEFESIQFTTKKYVLSEATENTPEQSSLVVDQVSDFGEKLVLCEFSPREKECIQILLQSNEAGGGIGVRQSEWAASAEAQGINRSTVTRTKKKLISNKLVDEDDEFLLPVAVLQTVAK